MKLFKISSGNTLPQLLHDPSKFEIMVRRTGTIMARFLALLALQINYLIWGESSIYALYLMIIFDLILMRNGQDWTAKILGLRVIRSNGDIAGLAHMWARMTVSLLSFLVFGLGYLWAYFDRNNQTLQDKLMGTYVVLDVPNFTGRHCSSGFKSRIYGYFTLGLTLGLFALLALRRIIGIV